MLCSCPISDLLLQIAAAKNILFSASSYKEMQSSFPMVLIPLPSSSFFSFLVSALA